MSGFFKVNVVDFEFFRKFKVSLCLKWMTNLNTKGAKRSVKMWAITIFKSFFQNYFVIQKIVLYICKEWGWFMFLQGSAALQKVELRQYKNGLASVKTMLVLKLPPFSITYTAQWKKSGNFQTSMGFTETNPFW